MSDNQNASEVNTDFLPSMILWVPVLLAFLKFAVPGILIIVWYRMTRTNIRLLREQNELSRRILRAVERNG